jgi:release factor glutamine methyltransferase
MMAVSISDALALHAQLETDSPRLDVECLLCHVLACEPVYLRTWPEKQLSPEQQTAFSALFKRRQLGEPVAHLCGKRAFWTLNLNVSPLTLIPRPDTELLVETILDLPLQIQASILDLGTGTGAIALALASERPEWQVCATDFLPEVVALAQENARIHHLQNVSVLQSNWFASLGGQRFDLIVSNPPYIDPDDRHLNEGDVRFEPRSALTADNHGLADLDHIIRQAPAYLKPKGWLVLEHGYDQAQAVQALFKESGYQAIQTKQDYGQQDRMTMAQYTLV